MKTFSIIFIIKFVWAKKRSSARFPVDTPFIAPELAKENPQLVRSLVRNSYKSWNPQSPNLAKIKNNWRKINSHILFIKYFLPVVVTLCFLLYKLYINISFISFAWIKTQNLGNLKRLYFSNLQLKFGIKLVYWQIKHNHRAIYSSIVCWFVTWWPSEWPWSTTSKQFGRNFGENFGQKSGLPFCSNSTL